MAKTRVPKAIIFPAGRKHAGKWRFLLIGTNGEAVGGSENEKYEKKDKAIKTLRKYFPNFKIYVSQVVSRLGRKHLIELANNDAGSKLQEV